MKYYNLFILIAGLLLGTPSKVFGQDAGGERCAVHLDKSFYVNGEVIWYKLYLPAALANGNPAIKVKLLDDQGRTVHYAFLKTKERSFVESYYKIPFDFPTGMYHLVFTANKSAGREPVLLAEIPVPVYNDNPQQSASPTMDIAAQAPESGASELPDALQVTLEVEKDRINRREPVRVSVRITDRAGRPVRAHLSAAVTDWELANHSVYDRPTVRMGPPVSGENAAGLDTTLYAKMKVMDNTGTPLQANVLGVFFPESLSLGYAKSDADGFSFVELPDFRDSKNIQLLGYSKETEEISVRLLEEEIPLTSTPLVFNEQIEEYLTLSRRRKKIFQHRTALEFQFEPEPVSRQVSLPDPDVVVNIQDYESFDNLAIFFREVLTPLRFRMQEDSTYYAAISNPGAQNNNYFLAGAPLFIIDGKVTRNADFIARIPPDQVLKAAIYNRRESLRKYFNVFGNSGVVVITTSIPDIDIPEEDAEDILSIKGLHPDAGFPVFHPEQVENDPHRAFFRPQLYWNPDLETDNDGRTSFSFHQSDDLSTFRIEVVAQTEDGKMGRGTVEYEVQ